VIPTGLGWPGWSRQGIQIRQGERFARVPASGAWAVVTGRSDPALIYTAEVLRLGPAAWNTLGSPRLTVVVVVMATT